MSDLPQNDPQNENLASDQELQESSGGMPPPQLARGLMEVEEGIPRLIAVNEGVMDAHALAHADVVREVEAVGMDGARAAAVEGARLPGGAKAGLVAGGGTLLGIDYVNHNFNISYDKDGLAIDNKKPK